MDRVKIVFFDLDDTLCGYWEACKVGLRNAFSKHCPEGCSVDEMVEHWATAFREFSPTLKKTGWYKGYLKSGEPTRTEQMRLTLQRAGVDDQDLAAKLSEAYAQERNESLCLFPESLEVLKNLSARYPLGLITNGPADIQREEIATLDIGKFFKHVYIEGEMGRGKPLPEVFEQIAQDVGCRAKEILFVGNSYAHDVKPALEAGWHAVWVRRPSDVPPSAAGMTSKPEEMPEGAPQPDAIISDLTELYAMLDLVPAQRAG